MKLKNIWFGVIMTVFANQALALPMYINSPDEVCTKLGNRSAKIGDKQFDLSVASLKRMNATALQISQDYWFGEKNPADPATKAMLLHIIYNSENCTVNAGTTIPKVSNSAFRADWQMKEIFNCQTGKPILMYNHNSVDDRANAMIHTILNCHNGDSPEHVVEEVNSWINNLAPAQPNYKRVVQTEHTIYVPMPKPLADQFRGGEPIFTH